MGLGVVEVVGGDTGIGNIVRGDSRIGNREIVLEQVVPFQIDEHRERCIEKSRHFSPLSTANGNRRIMLWLSVPVRCRSKPTGAVGLPTTSQDH